MAVKLALCYSFNKQHIIKWQFINCDKKAIIAEVKRNPRKLNAETLTSKSEVLKPNLDGYKIEYRLLSMEDM